MSEKAIYFNEREHPHPDRTVTPLPRAGEGPGERVPSE